MTPPGRQNPTFGAAPVAALMADLRACAWAVWFAAHYRLPAAPPTRDPNPRRKRQLLDAEQKRLDGLGATVSRDARAAFVLRNAAGVTLHAAADLVAVFTDRAPLLVCAHGGPPLAAHAATLFVTLHVYRLTRGQGAQPPTGRLLYASGHVDVPAAALDHNFEATFRSTMKTLTAATPPRRTPSPEECEACPISRDLCPQKADPPPPAPQPRLL